MVSNSLKIASTFGITLFLFGMITTVVPVEAATTFTVNSADDVDDGICDGTHCSFREAINAANANSGMDVIAFSIPGLGPHTIQPTSPLPTVTDSVIIDGYTQPGSSPNTRGPGSGLNTVLMIELDGTNAGNTVGLNITAGSSTVRGLIINRFGDLETQFGGSGIQLGTDFLSSGDNVIEGNFIGTDARGRSSLGNAGSGVRITSPNNKIGGTTPAAANVISGNAFNGVFMTGGIATGNLVQGNFIGTDITGTIALGNSFEGVRIVNAPNNRVGGITPESRNLISGNRNGLSIGGQPAAGNLVQGNFIGTDVTGRAGLGNSQRNGIYVNGVDNTLGGLTAGAGNVISSNSEDGVTIAGVFLTGDPVPGGAMGNLVQGNFIGTDISGTVALSNRRGIVILSADRSTIHSNSIFFNNDDGIIISSSSAASIFHNNIANNGVQASDDNSAGNDWYQLDLLEGNFWSDYPGLDDGSGAGKHAIAGDGIGDTDVPWFYDFYPLTAPIVVITFDSSPRGSWIEVDGVTYTISELPKSFTWISGVTHTFSTASMIELIGTRYSFTQWNDASTEISRTVTATDSQSYIAHFKTEHYLTIESPHGEPQGGGWYEAGNIASITIDATLVDHGNGTRRVFTGWTDDLESTEPSVIILMDGPKKVTPNWKTQYLVRLSSDYGEPQGEGWYDKGSTVAVSIEDTVPIRESSRMKFVEWSGDEASTDPTFSFTIDAPKNLLAVWKIQLFLTVEKNHSEGLVDRSSGWFDEGAMVIAEEFVEIVTGQIRLKFTGWTGDISSSNLAVTIGKDGPKLVMANWKTQYHMTIENEPLEGIANLSSEWYDEGTTLTITAEEIVEIVSGRTRLVFTGWSGDSSSSSPSITISMDAAKRFMASWTTQHFLTIKSESLENGVDVTSGWYDEGVTVNVEAEDIREILTGETRLKFTGWTGDISSSNLAVTIGMESPKLVMANWKIQHYLTIAKEPQDGIVDGSSEWYDEGTTLTITAEEIVEIVSGQTRLVFTGWSGSISSIDLAITVTMDEPMNPVAMWQKQHYLTVVSEIGDPHGEGLYDEGSTVTFSVTSPLGFLILQIFSGWSGDSTSNEAEDTMIMNSPKRVIANWSTDYTQLFIVVGGVSASATMGTILIRRRGKNRK